MNMNIKMNALKLFRTYIQKYKGRARFHNLFYNHGFTAVSLRNCRFAKSSGLAYTATATPAPSSHPVCGLMLIAGLAYCYCYSCYFISPFSWTHRPWVRAAPAFVVVFVCRSLLSLIKIAFNCFCSGSDVTNASGVLQLSQWRNRC